jgi:outer membrane lipoprotein-sorting protein
MVKKLWMWLLAVVLIPSVLQAQAVQDKKAFLKRLAEKHGQIDEASGKIEINMSMMGNNMKIPVSFWNKGEKLRMDMETRVPGMDAPMEQVMLMDGKKFVQYQKMMNTVMTADLTKMPEEIRKQMKRNQASMLGGITSISDMQEIEDELDIEEKTRDNRKYYLITLKDLNKLGGMSSVGGVNAQQMFGKLLLWIDYKSLLPSKMEFYGEADTPGMWIDILEFKPGSVPDAIFNVKFPDDAKHMDITDMMQNMFEKMK